jgi:hypothetical protein
VALLSRGASSRSLAMRFFSSSVIELSFRAYRPN